VLKESGHIDPEDIREYIYHGGYGAAKRAYTELTAQAVCEEILHSGLRGRGGGGFPTGRKWELTRVQPGGEEVRHLQRRRGRPRRFHGPAASWRATRTASSRA